MYTGECDNWVLVWESAPYEICAPDGTNPCDNNPDPNCLCEFYGLGCSDGGGDPPTDRQTILAQLVQQLQLFLKIVAT